MVEYIRALHPNPEQDGYNNDISDEKLSGCGDRVLVEYQEVPPIEEGDVFRARCPSCKHRNSRMEVLGVQREE
ncbi:hypothetical protein [Natronococcus roseus]|uniref:hypothetical protein n=1 Tax=Natronococcus roseus TaxID=1052014 RepID=UPI00374CA638